MADVRISSEILARLREVEVAVVATSAGTHLRQRMMHFAVDENFQIYLASMKGDPKTIQITGNPSVSLLVYNTNANLNLSGEVEITGKVVVIRDERQRRRSLELLAERSPVVKYLRDTGNESLLVCLEVVPQTIKYRVFQEIVQGKPPTVLELAESTDGPTDLALLGKKIGAWARGIRAPFLTASLVSLMLGAAIGWYETQIFHLWYFVLTLAAGLLLHIGANVLNDYFDHKSGNDERNREFVRPFSGGSRMIQLGRLTPLETLVGAILCLAGGSLIGLYLAWTRRPLLLIGGAIGLISAVFYSHGRTNWAGKGFGEMLVGTNFGLLMTVGAYYTQTRSIHLQPLVAGLPLTFLVAAILFVNGFLDFRADSASSKRTLVVRLGRKRAAAVYVGLIAACYLSLLLGVFFSVLPIQALAGLAALPLFLRAMVHVFQNYENPAELTPANVLTITGHLILGLILILSYIWVGFGGRKIGFTLALTAVFIGFSGYFYWHIEKRRQIFLGLRTAITGKGG